MGSLYSATDKVLGRKVAIKILRTEQMSDPMAITRFLQEARIHAQFHHPGIPPLHDVGRLPDGRPFLAMKLIRGQTLTDRANENPPAADWEFYRRLFEQACQVVAYAHSKAVFHRDLNPNNVLVSDRGRVQVIDWGLAKVLHTPFLRAGSPETGGTTQMSVPNLSHTDAGLAVGTPAYMAPEQSSGSAETTEQTDVFGLGSVLCFLLTGRPPHEGKSATVMQRLKAGDVSAALARLDGCGGPPDLVRLAKACLSADLRARPRHAGELITALGQVPPGVVPRRSWWEKLFGKRRK